MGASYQIWLRGKDGTILADITNLAVKWTWAKIVNDVGSFTIHLPEVFDETLVDQVTNTDQQIEIWRRAADSLPLHLELKGFVRRVVNATDEKGLTWHVLTGVDIMDLLARRYVYPYVPYTGGFWAPNIPDYADTIMRTIVNRNLGNGDSNATARDLTNTTTNTAGFTFAVESISTVTYCTTAGQMNAVVGGKNLLEALQEISESSKTYKALAGTLAVPVYFNIDYNDWNSFTFRVRSNRIGSDHSSDSGQPVFVGLDYGNLQTPSLDMDRLKEITCVYCARDRDVTNSQDDNRIGLSSLNRRELGITSSDLESTNIPALREATLNENKPKKVFAGKIIDAPGCLYGRDWGFGDELTVSYLGHQYDVMVKAISAEYGEDGERMSVVVEVNP